MIKKALATIATGLTCFFWILTAGYCGPTTQSLAATEVSFETAFQAFQSGDFQRALEMSEILIKKKPDDVAVYELRASIFMVQAKYDQVILTVITAEQNNAKSLYLYETQARAFFILGYLKEAQAALLKIEKLVNEKNNRKKHG